MFTTVAEWTDDAQGKKDYDAEFVGVTTRYWPRGGGITALDAAGFHTNEDQSIKPSATSEIYIRAKEGREFEEMVTLISREFEGETFEEVAAQVESWVQEQMNRVTKAVLEEFKRAG